jgi:hypothetical protein
MFPAFLHLVRNLWRRGRLAAALRPRGRVVPRVEALEARWVPSTISGSVYNDLNNNGILESGEPGIAGNTIELHDASGALIATTVTDAQGHYAFSVNPTLPPAEATKEVDATFGPFKTDDTKTVSVAQFDPSLGTLTGVDIINDGTLTSQIKIESLDTSPTEVTGNVSGTLTLQAPGVAPLVTDASDQEQADVGAFDGQMNFLGGSGHDFGPHSANGTKSVSLSASSTDLSAFTGTGSVSMTEAAKATSSASGPGNLLSQISSTASGTVRVIYHYTTSNALAPGQYTVVQPQDPPGFFDGADTSDNVHPIPGSYFTDSIPVTLGTTDSTNNNFGEVAPASVAGFVYVDSNNAGALQAGDLRLSGVTLSLTGTNDIGQPISLTTSTAADGSYQFTGLRPGTYTVSEVEPAGYSPGAVSTGNLGGQTSGRSVTTFLQAGSAGTDYNFGELLPQQQQQQPQQPQQTPPSLDQPMSKRDFIGNAWTQWGW